MSAARSARPPRRSTPTSRWSPTIRPCRSSRSPRPGTSSRTSRAAQWEKLPLLSAAAPFKAGGKPGPDYYTDVPVGPVAIKNVADLYLYPNTIRAVEVTGAQVREWLERSAGIFNQVKPGSKDADLIDLTFPSYNFDVIDGVTYKIDVSQPSRYDQKGVVIAPDAHRIVDLHVRRQADRRDGQVRRRHQQLPRRRRRLLPRRRWQDHHLPRPRHQPRHHRALHPRDRHDQPGGRRQLVAGAARPAPP